MPTKLGRFTISEDLSIEILKRLPIKSIIRFRCVCKSWNSSISSPFFFNLYHSFSTSSTPPHQKPYLLFDFIKTHLTIYNPIHPPYLTFLKYPNSPFTNNFSPNFTLIDLIHGVVCISYSTFSSSIYYSTALWNPSFHKYLPLPTATASAPASDKINIGFGFDNRTNDFKVVRVWNCNKYKKYKMCCEIYSSREGNWREKKGSDNKLEHELYEFRTKAGCFCNGCVNWIVSASRGKYSVLMFDCEEEVFRKTDLPEKASKVIDSSNLMVKIAEYSGKLVVAMYSRLVGSVDMWMMMEEEWIELNTVFEEVRNPMCRNGVPMLIKDGDIIRFRIWDPEEEEGFGNFVSHQPLRGGLFEESMFLMHEINRKAMPASFSPRT